MTSVLKRASNGSVSDRNGLCRATTRRGEPCRRKALDANGLCLVHNGSQDMRDWAAWAGARPRSPSGRARSGRACGSSCGARLTRPRCGLRSSRVLRARTNVTSWPAPNSSSASCTSRRRSGRGRSGRRLRVAGAAAPRGREGGREADAGRARRAGVIRPRVGLAGSRDGPFAGVVKFELRELAEWAAVWAPAPVAVSDVACGGCGKAGVRLVKEGESVDCEAVYCETCKSR